MIKKKNDPKIERLISQIAYKNLGIETLETRHSDSLDFHDCHAGCIRNALIQAYQAGVDSKKATKARFLKKNGIIATMPGI